MTDINIGAFAESLNDKMDRDGMNSQSPCAVVVAKQDPTSANNYTWYRKYSDGWVEQGGIKTGSVNIGSGSEGSLGAINLPITMANTNYTATASAGNDYCIFIRFEQATTTFTPIFGAYTAGRTLTKVMWQVSGIAAS